MPHSDELTIQRIYYGMNSDGKIVFLKTDGVNKLLSDQSIRKLRNLTQEDDQKYLWFRTEQILALPFVKEVHDGNGREGIQSHVFLIPLHDYFKITKPFKIINPDDIQIPTDTFQPLEVKTNG